MASKEKCLFAWIGNTDLAAMNKDLAGDGPIAMACKARSFNSLVLLSSQSKEATDEYLAWFGRKVTILKLKAVQTDITDPTDYNAIYHWAKQEIESARQEQGDSCRLVFHLSSGTPAMAIVWSHLAAYKYPADLIQTSDKTGCRDIKLPFEPSSDYLRRLMQNRDADLTEFSDGIMASAEAFGGISWSCKVMGETIELARKAAPRNIPVLIEGESGTGKELMAEAIHQASGRKGNFVRVNCGAFPEQLIESQLFGHVKGAFTGAEKLHIGYIEEANGGTLFLDEIGELPLLAQAKLLRALNDKKFRPVSDTKDKVSDFRLIAATNRQLVNEVAAGRFREDMYFRIAVAIVKIPALRDRGDDIALIAESEFDKICKELANQPGFVAQTLTKSGLQELQRHAWPGNIRELKNVLERASLWATGSEIDDAVIRKAILPVSTSGSDNILNRPLTKEVFEETLKEVERHYLLRALDTAKDNKSKAAEILGFNNSTTFNNRLEKVL